MSDKKHGSHAPPADESGEVLSGQVAQVQEILRLLGHTVSAMKLFPSDHGTVKKFVGELWERLNRYLEENWKLEVGIEENSFTFEGQVVYQETQPMKSLPFLFFKDGMQMLFFYKDMAKDELQGFLETIRKDAQLPPEESDLVLSLWEKDFANIRYFAPDDYLESKIGAGKAGISPDVDKAGLRTGQIELTSEDRAILEKSSREEAPPIEGRRAHQPEPGLGQPQTEDESTEIEALDEKEHAEIEAMLQMNRKISTEEEYINVVLEILYLEERTDRFSASLEVLGRYRQGLIQKGDFASDYLLLSQVQDLRGVYAPDDERAKQLEKFLKGSCDENTILALKKALQKGQLADYSLFFDYLNLFGWTAAPLVAELYETKEDRAFRELAAAYLEEKGREHLHALTALSHDSRPALTKTIICILGRIADMKVLHHLAPFTNSKNSAIKAEAIRVLGQHSDEIANKILLSFLSDGEATIRLAAAGNLRFLGDRDRSTIESLLQLLRQKSFSNKSHEEKRAILNFLAKCQNPDDIRFMSNALRKIGVFSNASRVDTRLCAIEAFEQANTPQSIEALKALTKAGNRRIRQAAGAALSNLSNPFSQKTGPRKDN